MWKQKLHETIWAPFDRSNDEDYPEKNADAFVEIIHHNYTRRSL